MDAKLIAFTAALACASMASPAADFISVEGPVPEVNRGGCSTAVFVRPVTNRAAVVSAKWTVTGLGVFRVFLNGAEVGAEDFLKPGYTHPHKRRSSFSYDVTDAFRRDPGARNVLCAEVSTGWWRDAIIGRAGKVSAFQGVLKLAYADGSAEEIVSDTSWRAAYAGPLRHATIWGGERYDARVPTPWRTTGDVDWKRARVNGEFKGAVTPLEGRSVRVRRDLAFAPRDAWAWKGADGAAKDRHGRARILRRYAGGEALVLEPGETLVVDFGQNCAGVPEFAARAAAGTELSGHPAEMLNDANGERSRGNDGPAGSAYFANYRTAESRLRYVFAGGDGETWHPSCTFFGGRYWSFTANGRVEFKRLSLLPVMSIAPEDETGTIVTGDASLNRLISNCLWGMRSNYLSVPTDCPQRNERWGWTGDTQVFVGAAVYAADVYGFLTKWMTDMRDSQADEKSKCPGMFPKIAPDRSGGRLIGWADAGVIVPYTMWRQFGDVGAVNVNWDAMARFLANLDKSNWTTPENERQCVDWLSPAMYEGHRRGWGSKFCKNPFWDGETNADERQYWDMLGACYHIWDLKMMVEMAKATGRDKEAAAYAQREAKAVARYRSLFLDHHGRFAERYRNMQTPNLFALKLGLFPTQAATDAAKADLVASIKAGNCKVGTGFLGTPLLLDVIADIVGDPALAYSVLLQRDCPGWLYSVDNGATTIWERWDGYTKERGFGPPEMNSFNHYANGAVLGWMYRTMAGIRPGKEAGYRHFTLAPKPDKRIGSCKASYRTKYGTVKSEWRYVDGGKLEWSFTVPPCTTATVVPPDGGPTVERGPGDYRMPSDSVADGGVQKGDPFRSVTAPKTECRVPLKLLPRNNMPLVEADVDGAKCTFLLDTGATHTTFDLAFVKKNLPNATLTPVAMMAETNVEGAPRYMRVKSMKLGAAEFGDFGAMALDISHLHASVGVKVDGILGMSTLGRVPCIVSFGAGEVVFAPGKESLARFGRLVQRSLSDPMSILLPVKFGERTFEVLVDSGASLTFLSRETGWPTTGEAANVPAVDINGKAKLAPLVGKKGVLPVGDGIEISPFVVSAPMNRIGSDVLIAYDMLIAGRYVSFRRHP